MSYPGGAVVHLLNSLPHLVVKNDIITAGSYLVNGVFVYRSYSAVNRAHQQLGHAGSPLTGYAKIVHFAERILYHLLVEVEAVVDRYKFRDARSTGSAAHLDDIYILSVHKHVRVERAVIEPERLYRQSHLLVDLRKHLFTVAVRERMPRRYRSAFELVGVFRVRSNEHDLAVLDHAVDAYLLAVKLLLNEHIALVGVSHGCLISLLQLFPGIHHVDAAASRAVHALNDYRISYLFSCGICLIEALGFDEFRSRNSAGCEGFLHFVLVAGLDGSFFGYACEAHRLVYMTNRSNGYVCARSTDSAYTFLFADLKDGFLVYCVDVADLVCIRKPRIIARYTRNYCIKSHALSRSYQRHLIHACAEYHDLLHQSTPFLSSNPTVSRIMYCGVLFSISIIFPRYSPTIPSTISTIPKNRAMTHIVDDQPTGRSGDSILLMIM